MKGLELPISTLIILVIALVILIAVIAIFSGSFGPASKGFSLETATRSTCQKASKYCEYSDINRFMAARTPVDGFDANKDGKNSYQYDANNGRLSHYCIDDNLEALCGFYYGCKNDKCPSGDKSTFDPYDPSNGNLLTAADWQNWWQCCMIRVCGC
jgi:hypothetical protein